MVELVKQTIALRGQRYCPRVVCAKAAHLPPVPLHTFQILET